MTTIKEYAILDQAGQVARLVSASDTDAPAEVGSGEVMRLATDSDRQALKDRLTALRASIEAFKPAATDMEVLLEALKAKGITINPADLASASAALKAKAK